jgi:hypothetical protein
MDKSNSMEMSTSTAHIETIQKGAAGIESGPELLVDEKNQIEGDYSGATAKTDPAEIALVRKLDRRILPTLCAMYFLNYVRIMSIYCGALINRSQLDRTSIASARLNHLERDLNLEGNQYNTCISILFVG